MSEVNFLEELFRRYNDEFNDDLAKEVKLFLETEDIEDLQRLAKKLNIEIDKEDLKEKIAYELIEKFFKQRYK